MDTITKYKATDHPLENLFDIEPSTTMTQYKEIVPAEVVELPSYDAKDNEIENKLEDVYTIAMSNVATISDEMERVEGKYKARIGEVTAAMLNVALTAVREKAALKMHKDKLPTAVATNHPGSHTVNNNLIVADRNEFLRMWENSNK